MRQLPDFRVLVPLLLALLVSACSVDPIDDGTIVVSISSSSSIASPGAPIVITVTARNMTSDRVEWGRGSSGCQLSLAVLTAAGVRYGADTRACTEDLVPQALAPGAQRTETFEWSGEAIVDGQLVTLPAGTYRFFGNAGDKGESESLEIVLAGT